MRRKAGIIFFFFPVFFFVSSAGQPLSDRIRKNKEQSYEDNLSCFRCHGTDRIDNDSQKIVMKKKNVLDTLLYYSSVHGSFRCLDCHAEEYGQYPHPVSLSDETFLSCLDCHGGNKKTAAYHFEQIAEAFDKSVHAEKGGEDFTCWKCHSPHAYVNYMRNADSVGFAVAIREDNAMCLKCHDTMHDGSSGNTLARMHKWLPNQSLHFLHVRCLDCHAEVPDTIRVSHHIFPAAMAVRNCVACHQVNSRLLETLYKYHRSLHRQQKGFYNPEILKNSYVIGANRNYLLNLISVIIFGVALLGMVVHFFIRIFVKRK